MGTKGPKAGNIFTSLRSRGLVGGQGQDPSIKGMGSPFKQTNGDGKDGSAYGAIKRFGEGFVNHVKTGLQKDANTVKKVVKNVGKNITKVYSDPKALVSNTLGSLGEMVGSLGQGNRHMDGPAPKAEESKKQVPPSKSKNSKAVLESEKKGDEAINDPMKKKATPFKKCGCGKKKCNC